MPVNNVRTHDSDMIKKLRKMTSWVGIMGLGMECLALMIV